MVPDEVVIKTVRELETASLEAWRAGKTKTPRSLDDIVKEAERLTGRDSRDIHQVLLDDLLCNGAG